MVWFLLACREDDARDESAYVAPRIADDAPVISAATAECYLHTTGEGYWQWELAGKVTDPDGAETVARTGIAAASSGAGDVRAEVTFVRTGEALFGSFKETDYDILCGDAATITFVFTISDNDGNVSAPVTTIGRKRT